MSVVNVIIAPYIAGLLIAPNLTASKFMIKGPIVCAILIVVKYELSILPLFFDVEVFWIIVIACDENGAENTVIIAYMISEK